MINMDSFCWDNINRSLKILLLYACPRILGQVTNVNLLKLKKLTGSEYPAAQYDHILCTEIKNMINMMKSMIRMLNKMVTRIHAFDDGAPSPCFKLPHSAR